MPPPAPQSAARLPSHARYGVRAVAAGNDSQKTHGEAMYTAADCAARAALQVPVPQCKPFSGGYKGGVLFCEREHLFIEGKRGGKSGLVIEPPLIPGSAEWDRVYFRKQRKSGRP